MQLTDSRVFEPEWECATCGKPVDDCTEHADVQAKNYQHLLDSPFEVDIVLRRIPGAENDVGSALVNIEQRLIVHSPTGFEWGYGGSGPSDLALNILALFVPPQEAYRLHHHYKADVICGIPREGAVIPAKSVVQWIQRQWIREQEAHNEHA